MEGAPQPARAERGTGAGASVAAILAWYRRHRRDLPWRRTRDPYRILVSEVMLQQTQVVRVIPHYERFLERFPDAPTLAAAPLADVLGAWSGLGYNRRALALQRAARAVAARGWPRTPDALRELPGVGPYTAAAVASFAWGMPVAAVDVNARRVIGRLDGRTRTPAALRSRAAELVPADTAADWNQALMDLGATVCVARRPACVRCPASSCRSRGAVEPAPRPGPARPSPRTRFEDSDRYARGLVLRRLVARTPPPGELELGAERLARAIAGLERDGLVVRQGDGVALPDGRSPAKLPEGP